MLFGFDSIGLNFTLLFLKSGFIELFELASGSVHWLSHLPILVGCIAGFTMMTFSDKGKLPTAFPDTLFWIFHWYMARENPKNISW